MREGESMRRVRQRFILAVAVVAATTLGAPIEAQEEPSAIEQGTLIRPFDADGPSDPVNRDEAGRRIPPDAIEPAAWPRSGRIWPAPEPFTVNGYDARMAVALLERVGLVVIPAGESTRRIVAVESVRAVTVGVDERFPTVHRERWDLLLNGTPLAWRETYVEYGGRLVNLQLLFTYRNQRPVPDVPFRLQ